MYFSREDAAYWYEIHGEGVPVVMLHGFTGSSAAWKPFVDSWGSGYQLITVDLPGHGKTRTPSPRSMADCCKDLFELFQSIDLGPFHLLGYSMGGRTALSYAILFQDSLRSLILESSSPGIADEEARKSRKENDEKLAERIEQCGISSFVDFWQDIPLFDSQKRLSADVQGSLRAERLSQSAEGLAQSLRMMGTGNQLSLWDRLHDFKKPVLLIAGELDEKFVAINKKMQKKLISCNLIICEDAGHAIHVEKPNTFGKMVKAFIHANTHTD
ncbi:2-succinyl-6-hydroxy-2,4-cyclohexadiene-1-carboxylate synthase [Oceanobacillus saliphilus]|uniref:2-succinyl-6-hydroxy-2, 4-cyclohexadiene-1-carboxylate synthase n=1 Tax=Oceanobacillus saliphilus TaxID=2925834 RepID=UPI00201D3933|nr:2-succinyl-6-hydroxy-2,4-cyclohexadiene-1-carboxylate synthase [Oceanobacillus saliphilus]